MAFDLLTVTNLVLTVVICVLGIGLYGRKKNVGVLYIGVAFGLLAISHLATLLDLAASLTVPLVILRTIGYLIIIYALLVLAKK